MRSIINKLKFTILFIWNQYINLSLKFIKIEKIKYFIHKAKKLSQFISV
jgi:hypothetical protein